MPAILSTHPRHIMTRAQFFSCHVVLTHASGLCLASPISGDHSITFSIQQDIKYHIFRWHPTSFLSSELYLWICFFAFVVIEDEMLFKNKLKEKSTDLGSQFQTTVCHNRELTEARGTRSHHLHNEEKVINSCMLHSFLSLLTQSRIQPGNGATHDTQVYQPQVTQPRWAPTRYSDGPISQVM